MQPTIHRIPMAQLAGPDAQPLTRGSVIDLVRRTVNKPAREVRIEVTVDHDDGGPAIVLATIELNSAPDGNWWLQFVSHPAQSCGLTASIAPCTSDFVAFTRARKMMRLPHALTFVCAPELEDEGLGPLAVLNLRLRNPAPVLPSKANIDQLAALTNIEPTHQR